ncbi:septal ring lytic transglycosylase RlpA family protein [Acidovorax sp. Leaf160]|uniref:septal ring lytic transglycosylase RlpA family protein n=1 Tax=Acidovorax sp. Leaf160 TaxID=1736280 RepID=UPI000A908BB5|nr:septal ring lytic transglycosylase RlpA family protein [Acidovorax sp. Leaf160]
MRRIAVAGLRHLLVSLSPRTLRRSAVLASVFVLTACAVPSAPPVPGGDRAGDGDSPAAAVPSAAPSRAPLRTLIAPPRSAAAAPADAGSGSGSGSASREGASARAAADAAAAAPGRRPAQREADLPPISTVVPSIAPAGVPGPNGMYSLERDKPGEGLRGPDAGEDAEPDEQGMASWYGARFHKRRTASGERFDMYALTAAHPTLPFGTRVCVRSLSTGRSVQVRINDRGPHAAGRIIDLSQAAAKQLGMLGLGTKSVAITALAAEDDGGCPDKDQAD